MHTSRTFVLRFWEEARAMPDATPAWRMIVEEVGSDRRRRGFGSFEAMVAFLGAEFGQGEAVRDGGGARIDDGETSVGDAGEGDVGEGDEGV